ncbi:hypothetical protein D0Z06_00780 [Geodermatophilus marinus]|nr:hypothetical protein D0Z06_00780 [Geodermatophilus sp. LHW52908]
MIWLAVAVLGFLALGAVVVALGTSSTARYEFERNRAQERRQQAAPVTAAAAPRGAAAQAAPAVDGARPAQPAQAQAARAQAAPVRVATHPAGERSRRTAPAWWLVDQAADLPGGEVVAGPFGDRLDADWVALSQQLADSVRADHGVLREDGGLDRRSQPHDRAWTQELGTHLVRLGEEWDDLVTDDDALGTLVVDVAAALVEAGLPVHDCAGAGSEGGVCLTPQADRGGVLVSWHRHERMSVHRARGEALDAAVQRTMNAALTEVLVQMGCTVQPYGPAGCSLVTAARP